jgi:hypothetical protein
MTADAAAAREAVEELERRCGADAPESHVPALHAIATGCGDGSGTLAIPNDPGNSCLREDLIGYPHFREGSVPIIVLLTDAPFHNGPLRANPYGVIPGVTPPTYDQTVEALNEIHARVIGVNSGGAIGRVHLVELATDTGTVGARGPLVYDIAGTGVGLGDQVISAVQALASGVPLDITVRAVDAPDDEVNAVEAFISRVEPNVAGLGDCAGGLTTDDDDDDGVLDTFLSVIPGTTVCFDVVPRMNETIESTGRPQSFRATIQVWGDHVTLLDERDVFFLVPAVIAGDQ